MSKNIDSLYICPWSLNDPLCRSQSLAYIYGLAEGGYRFALLTFEAPQFEMSTAEQMETKGLLTEKGIYWYPVKWSRGNSISDKLLGIWSALATGIGVCLRHRPKMVHSRSSLPLFASVALSKLFRIKFLYDADSLLSDEYVDIGHFSRESRAFRFLAWTEKWARENADRIIVLTNKLREVYTDKFGVKVPIDVIPCCVDTERFRFDPNARLRLRSELGLNNEIVLTYVGKVGSWYLVEETFELFKVFNSIHPSSRLLVISRDDPAAFGEIGADVGVKEDLYFVRASEYSDVPKWLSASDVGLSLIRQVKSKIGSSPVKFAEYLSVGLPVVVTDRIGDCSSVVRKDDVGVVLEQTSEESYHSVSEGVLRLLGDDSGDTSVRCRNASLVNFSVELVGVERYRDVYEAMIASR